MALLFHTLQETEQRSSDATLRAQHEGLTQLYEEQKASHSSIYKIFFLNFFLKVARIYMKYI